jgi:hypothetical protein
LSNPVREAISIPPPQTAINTISTRNRRNQRRKNRGERGGSVREIFRDASASRGFSTSARDMGNPRRRAWRR